LLPNATSPNPVQKTATKNLLEVVQSQCCFKTLLRALKAAGLTETLAATGPFTLFAPTDTAFAKLRQDALQDLLKPQNKEVLVNVLKYHLVRGKILADDLKSGSLTSLQGDPITVKVSSQGIILDDASVTQADLPASNGVVHQINTVILPPSL
jgi:uncharacterized surface protein with fasciclin (FAS1) repeats